MAESIMDFESSITKEMELAAILGKRIDFNEARRLFATGKIGAATANIGATSVKDSVIADMDAGDTAKLLFYVYDGRQTIDINSGNNSYFSGYLLV